MKAYHGSPGILDVAGRARGHLQYWRKWTFPFGPPRHNGGHPAGWRPVGKRRRISRFCLAGGQAVTAGHNAGPCCAVELTKVSMNGEQWWSLGYEATGPPGLLRTELEATAALVFSQALPGGAELRTGDSRSYAEWLSLQPGTRPR